MFQWKQKGLGVGRSEIRIVLALPFIDYRSTSNLLLCRSNTYYHPSLVDKIPTPCKSIIKIASQKIFRVTNSQIVYVRFDCPSTGPVTHEMHPQSQSKLQDDVPPPSSRSPRPHPVDGHGFCAVVADLAHDELAACGRDHSRRRDHPRSHHPPGQLRPRSDQGYTRGNVGRNPSARSGAFGCLD